MFAIATYRSSVASLPNNSRVSCFRCAPSVTRWNNLNVIITTYCATFWRPPKLPLPSRLTICGCYSKFSLRFVRWRPRNKTKTLSTTFANPNDRPMRSPWFYFPTSAVSHTWRHFLAVPPLSHVQTVKLTIAASTRPPQGLRCVPIGSVFGGGAFRALN